MAQEDYEIQVVGDLLGIWASWRKRERVTQQVAAEALGITQGYLSRIEKGGIDLRLNLVVKMIQVMGYTLELNVEDMEERESAREVDSAASAELDLEVGPHGPEGELADVD